MAVSAQAKTASHTSPLGGSGNRLPRGPLRVTASLASSSGGYEVQRPFLGPRKSTFPSKRKTGSGLGPAGNARVPPTRAVAARERGGPLTRSGVVFASRPRSARRPAQTALESSDQFLRTAFVPGWPAFSQKIHWALSMESRKIECSVSNAPRRIAS